MSEVKHTPGPWSVETNELLGLFWIDDEDGLDVCDLYHSSRTGKFIVKQNAEANAKLISAAPELLAALKNFADKIDPVILVERDHPTSFLAEPLREAIEAIAKAEGR